jgi:hypothetical protein
VLDGRKSLQKAQVVWDDRLHLSLLQHDFGDPHCIRVLRSSPGETSPLSEIPSQQLLSEASNSCPVKSYLIRCLTMFWHQLTFLL